MLVFRLFRVPLALLSISSAAAAQDWRDDDSIWNFGGIGGPHRAGPRPPEPPPIVPGEWTAVPASDDEPALLVVPWVLDPDRAAPKLGESGWTAKLAPPLAAAACAHATVVSDVDEVRMARLTGARWLVVNGSVHIGDPERRGDRGVPVALKKGENQVFVVDATAGWELELWKPATRCVIGTWDVGWPHTTGNAEDIEYPVFNASVEPVSTLHVHYGHGYVPSTSCRIGLTDWRCAGVIAPLSLLISGHYFWDIFGNCTPTPGRAGNRSPVCVYAGNDDDPARDPEAAREILCDLDSSYERRRLAPSARALARGNLAHTQQGRIPTAVPGEWGPKEVILVYGTRGDPRSSAALLARARLDQQVLWYTCGEASLVLSDVQYVAAGSNRWLAEEVRDAPVVIYGASSTNSACDGLDSSDLDRASRAFDPARSTPGRDGLAGTVRWIDPKREGFTALGFASAGPSGARLSLALAMRDARDDFVRVDPASPTGFSPLGPTAK